MEWRAALYGRVSTDHEEQQESIKVQKDFLSQYANDNGYSVISQYFDEGYTGTNFSRPGIELLKKDIAYERINIILVKDLSRIGRSNAHTLLFLDYLAEKNIRLVAVSDNYDTFSDDDGLVGIKTWFNELYSRELSKKIKLSLTHKKKMGEYITPYAPYGYKKSGTQKNTLEKDWYAANVIKEIYDMYINGLGFQRIAETLQQRGIPNPSRYGRYSKKSIGWDWTMVRKIITNPVYTGCSIQQRYYKQNFKSKSMARAPSSHWIKVENTHEAIIKYETYELAQEILKKRSSGYKYRCGPSEPHLFSSFLFCHECGSPLYYKKGSNDRGTYRCGRYVKYGKKGCTSHLIYEDELRSVVVERMNDIALKRIETDMLVGEVSKLYCETYDAAGKIGAMELQMKKYSGKKDLLYKDRLEGVIDIEMFSKYMDEINRIQSYLQKELSELNDTIENEDEKKSLQQINDLIRFTSGIDREILERFVKRIEICENGDILIFYNFNI